MDVNEHERPSNITLNSSKGTVLLLLFSISQSVFGISRRDMFKYKPVGGFTIELRSSILLNDEFWENLRGECCFLLFPGDFMIGLGGVLGSSWYDALTISFIASEISNKYFI